MTSLLRIRWILGAAALILIAYGAWAFFAPANRTCQDGDNVCLYHEVLQITDARNMQNHERDEIYVQAMDLCGRMTESRKRDECYFRIVLGSNGQQGHEACLQILDIAYQQEYLNECELREIQVKLRSMREADLDGPLFDSIFERCSQLANQYSTHDKCLFELAIHYSGDLAVRACHALPVEEVLVEGYTFSRKACLEHIGTVLDD